MTSWFVVSWARTYSRCYCYIRHPAMTLVLFYLLLLLLVVWCARCQACSCSAGCRFSQSTSSTPSVSDTTCSTTALSVTSTRSSSPSSSGSAQALFSEMSDALKTVLLRPIPRLEDNRSGVDGQVKLYLLTYLFTYIFRLARLHQQFP